jgi:hypothetical protein
LGVWFFMVYKSRCFVCNRFVVRKCVRDLLVDGRLQDVCMSCYRKALRKKKDSPIFLPKTL